MKANEVYPDWDPLQDSEEQYQLQRGVLLWVVVVGAPNWLKGRKCSHYVWRDRQSPAREILFYSGIGTLLLQVALPT